jgi:glycosyltransferase involved in cell wall biosynthesis
VRSGFEDRHRGAYEAEIVELDPGLTGDNRVRVTAESGDEISSLVEQMRQTMGDVNVVLSHDLIYQPNMWKQHVAARRLAAERPDLRWLHWVHSATNLNAANRTGGFRRELSGPFPNSKIVAFHAEEINRKGSMYGYERDQVLVIPNSIDFTADFHPAARQLVESANLMKADLILIYPCRLDSGKQPHILIEIGAALREAGYDTRVVFCDFHSKDGDKAAYRDRLKQKGGDFTYFTSDLEGEENGAPYSYCIPHQAVMDLMRLADFLVHPSMSESGPLTIPEAMFARCGLVLNFDLPVFRQWDEYALMGKFSSGIDALTGGIGETTTTYANREEYMRHIAAGVVYLSEHNPVLKAHVQARKVYSLEAVWPKLWSAIEGAW